MTDPIITPAPAKQSVVHSAEDTAKRAALTFVEATFAAWVVAGSSETRAALIGAAAAGASAAWHKVLSPVAAKVVAAVRARLHV